MLGSMSKETDVGPIRMEVHAETRERILVTSGTVKPGEEASWAFASDKLGRWLLHLPSGVVGKVGKVYAPGEYRGPNPILGEVTIAVLEFEDGNAFLAARGNFQVLTEMDVDVFRAMTKGINDLCVGIATLVTPHLRISGSTPESVAAVIRAALQAQVRALTPR